MKKHVTLQESRADLTLSLLVFRNKGGDKGSSSLRLTHEQSIFSYFNISSDFLSLFLNFYNLD